MAHTLLLADDSVTIQRVIELTFADEDVEVVAVSDGDQAIARLESAPPDIVLADIGMPGRNGYEVARYVKQSPKLSHIPVVLLTGAFEPVDQARATEVGCDGVLAKPFEPQLVIGRVKELLASDGRRAPAATAATSVTAAGSTAAAAAAPAPVQAGEPVKEAVSAELTEARADLDDYFDRLDVAFQKLSANPPLPLRGQRPVPLDEEPEPAPYVAPPPAPEPFVAPVETPSFEPPVSYASPKPVFEAPAAPPVIHAAAPPAPAPVMAAPAAARSGATRALPSIGDAFAAILASEHGEADEAGRPAWPAAFAAPEPPPLVVGDEVVEQIVQRVIARMSDQAVRDATRTVVGEIAERLVREEIERIKSALK